MGLLVWIKTICDIYDSPSVAYYCGQTQGQGFYSEDISDIPSTLQQCLVPPATCKAENYYNQPIGTDTFKVYTEYGYTASGKNYPFYGVTIADESRTYDQVNDLIASQNITFGVDNPSLPLERIALRYSMYDARIAVCPQSKDGALQPPTQAFFQHVQSYLSATPQVPIWFDSEADLASYVASRSYGDSSHPKVGMAVVFNKVDTIKNQWDYSIR